jgi:predicted amidohydrolase YtcJ
MTHTLAGGAVVWLLGTCLGTSVLAAPTLLENVHGLTLSGAAARAAGPKRFEAMVFDGGKILAVGDTATLERTYKSAVRVDGHGETVLPGLIDAHGHVIDLGLVTTRAQLFDSTSLTDAQSRIRAHAAATAGRAWVLGGGWNQVTWKLGRFPTAAELDAVVADRPAVMERVDGHAKWLNTRALAAAGITRDTPDPVGGRIERAADGSPAGVLVDKAMDLVDKVVPPPNEAEQRAALEAALRHLNSVGLTGVGDAGVDAHEIGLYRALADEGALSVRIYAMIGGVGKDFAALSKQGPLLGYGGDRLTVRSVKLFADGALGSRGAAMLQPYADAPGQKGLLFMTDAAMRADVATALKAGYQVNVHAIGDAANRQVLDAFEAAYRTVGGRGLRNRIEHAQVVALTDIPRFKQLDLIASMQPTHATSDKAMAEDRVGRERLAGAYAWRRYIDQGTRIAGGSDFPVESDNPFFGLHAAVTRTDRDGRPPGGWHPEQALTLVEAFRAFTLDAAYAQHQESTVGSLEPGKWADFIVVDRDPFGIPAQDLWKIQVRETWVAGKQVFAAAAAAMAAPVPRPATACAALAGFEVAASGIGLPTSGATVESARWRASTAEGNPNGEYCEVKGWIRPVTADAPRMQFEVNLPGAWNHKLLQMGGGGYDGLLVTGLGAEGLQPKSLPSPLQRGYATAGSDGGHQGTAPFDGAFGVNDEALANYGRESVKKVHDVAAAIVAAYYGSRASRSYFIGNSQGGHEALDAAARYPADFDGVVANYPAYDVTLLHLGSLNVGQALYGHGGAGWLSPAKTALLTGAVRRTCDPLDGATDGIIGNVAACRRTFNLDTVKRTLRCAGGADTGAECLSDAQIAAVARITTPYRPGFAIAGAQEFAPWALLEGSRFEISNFGASPVPGDPPTPKDALLYAVGTATVRSIITRDPKADALGFDPGAHRARIEAVARLLDVTDVDLTPFRARGGKLILVHGTEDDFITPGNSEAYFRRHLARQGRSAMDSFVRFYLVPGLSHGFGSFNAKYDGLGALEQWVEQGAAPGTLTAVDENPEAHGRTRPMCVYPAWPKFTGRAGASVEDAAGFACVTR